MPAKFFSHKEVHFGFLFWNLYLELLAILRISGLDHTLRTCSFRGLRSVPLDPLFASVLLAFTINKCLLPHWEWGAWADRILWHCLVLGNQQIWVISPILQLNCSPLCCWEVTLPSQVTSSLTWGLRKLPAFMSYLDSLMSTKWGPLCTSTMWTEVLYRCELCSWDVCFMKDGVKLWSWPVVVRGILAPWGEAERWLRVG